LSKLGSPTIVEGGLSRLPGIFVPGLLALTSVALDANAGVFGLAVIDDLPCVRRWVRRGRPNGDVLWFLGRWMY
jgi:hypothetical protein